MTDRELLEMAAIASGATHAIAGRVCGLLGHLRVSDGGLLCDNELYWNPLTDDGDALRLAVKLKLCFGPNFDGDLAVCFGEDGRNITEPLNPDPAAATRRAIVRAAAEIGKAM